MIIRNYKIILVVIYFVLFTSIFSLIVPVYEGPDENLHLDFINYVIVYKSLPDQYEGMQNKEKFVGQGHQHPLYYILTGIVLNILNEGNKISINSRLNGLHSWNGGPENYVPVFKNNHENVFNSEKDKYYFLAIRFLSVLFGAINIIFVYKISLLLTDNDTLSAVTAFLLASLPQFAFISGLINNDNPANMMSTICLYMFFKVFKEGYNLKSIIILGILLGLALLTKKTLVFLIPGFIIMFLYKSFFIDNEYIKSFKYIVTALLIAFFFNSIILARNYIVYNEFFGTQMEINTMPQMVDRKSLFSIYFLNPFLPGLLYSFIGSFGWLTIRFPIYVYLIYLFLAIASIFGYIKSSLLRNKILFNNIALMIFFILICLSGIIYFNLSFRQYQGRYMFPVASLIMIILSIGLHGLAVMVKNYTIRKVMSISLIILLFLIDVFSLILVNNFYNSPSNYL